MMRSKSRWMAIAIGTTLIGWAIVSYYRNSADRQRELVNVIEDSGGEVEYAYEFDKMNDRGDAAEDARPYGPPLLLRAFGIDAFNDVVAVGYYEWCSDENLVPRFREFPKLRVLRIEDRRVNDELLLWIDSSRRLEEVYLAGCGIGDRTVSRLSELPHLRSLDLRYTRVTDAGIDMLLKSQSLRELSLSPNQASPNAIHKLREANPACRIYQGG